MRRTRKIFIKSTEAKLGYFGVQGFHVFHMVTISQGKTASVLLLNGSWLHLVVLILCAVGSHSLMTFRLERSKTQLEKTERQNLSSTGPNAAPPPSTAVG